jgi:hypothetical protein
MPTDVNVVVVYLRLRFVAALFLYSLLPPTASLPLPHRFLHRPKTMFSTLFSVALFAAAAIRGVSAAFAVNSPQIVQVRRHRPLSARLASY